MPNRTLAESIGQSFIDANCVVGIQAGAGATTTYLRGGHTNRTGNAAGTISVGGANNGGQFGTVPVIGVVHREKFLYEKDSSF